MRLYPGMPYGQAPGWCFPVFEWSLFALLALCAVHAWRRHRELLPYLAGGFTFGVLLEYMEVVSHSYVYGHFAVMVGHAPLDVPLCIGAGWGIILYTARLLTDRFALPLLASAALETMVALNIDLSMDTVAYRLHMWHWFWDDPRTALTSQWFGIPYGNFNGWITVVFCYSAFSRWFERLLLRNRHNSFGWRILIAVLALLCSLATLFATETYVYPALVRIGITSGIRLSLLVAVLFVIAALGWRRRRNRQATLPHVAVWVPCWFHLYFLFCFFVLGFYRENRWLTVVALINVVLGAAVHFAPFRSRSSGQTGQVGTSQARLAG